MILTVAILAVLALIAGWIAGRQDPKKPLKGIRIGAKMLWNLLPLLLAAFAVAGFLEVVLPPSLIQHWLAGNAGMKGVLIGSIGGALIPGGPYVAFPIIAAIYRAGAGLGAVVAFITSWATWNTGLLAFELALVGPRFTLIHMVATLVFPPLAGFIAYALMH